MTKNDPRPLVPYLRQSRAKERTISIDEQRRDIRKWTARQKRLDNARAKVQAASVRTMRLPLGGSLIELWDGFTPAERRDVLAGFLDRIDVRRGASSDLTGHVRIVWTDGSVAYKEKRVRIAAA